MSTSGASEQIVVRLDPGHPGAGQLDLQVTPFYADELKELLDKEGVQTSTVAEFSTGVELVKYAVAVVGSVGGLAGLARVLDTFLRRHRDKKITIQSRDREISVEGYSEKSAQKLINSAMATQRRWDKIWEERTSGSSHRPRSESPDEGPYS